MEIKKYSSYAQIERELEILRIEKEISYQKLAYGFQKTKDSITPSNIVSGVIGSSLNAFSGSYGSILTIILPFVIKWIKKIKRG
ncbi:hypothetical protein EKM02_03980 [Flavobacterium sp. RSP49]|uniref:DUF6327 family protein n=1 Tax=unclassified Flavobacterium TaxID=196869 RepID=UPI000F81CCBD|nr:MULTISPECIES: DUF6327 family protein [unclassified Flavobacterium]RTY88298.1 hypothetical protein EKM00_03860 [Flavobacterium sp. RSP15]RTZ02248.1 hypothetical protein EKM02_03980 [Flavobacterium sp. RSP49]